MRISLDQLVKMVLEKRIDELKSFLENHSRKKIDDSLLTVEETTILLLVNILGYRVDEIAEVLGISRSSIYAALKRAKMKTCIAEKTIKYYNGLTNTIKVSVSKGDDLKEVIDKIFKRADELRYKLPIRSLEIAEELSRIGIARGNLIVRDAEIIVLPGVGIYYIEK